MNTPSADPRNAGAKPGDIWVFARKGFFNRIVQIKTWSRFSHVEVVAYQTDHGPELAASRNVVGVNLYQPEPEGLALIVRPTVPFDRHAAVRWFIDRAYGQGYDYIGLLNFFTARTLGNNNRMFCSEFATRFLRRGGIDPFPGADADCVPPSWFALNSVLSVVWRSADEWDRKWEQDARDKRDLAEPVGYNEWL